ncbi:MAG: hypothetical protein K9K67_13585 [Bacteriovoracaceae bacterium]|nr:hypothetical protein [Bacteriovoracaceae bacterium]
MKKGLIFLIFFFIFPSGHALIELNGEYGVSTQKYGANRDNEIEATTIGGSVALYLFDLTAIELNYSQTETVTSETNVLTIDSTYDLIGQENNVLVYSYGIGIRQAFASRKARFRPSMSLGYARQFIRDTTQATFRNNITGNTFIVNDDVTKLRDDSVFGSFNLELRLTNTVSLRGSVKTIFRAFDFDKAQDNIRYLLGFSWYL